MLARGVDHRPDHFRIPDTGYRIPDTAVGSAELRLIGLDDGVPGEQVELAWLEAVLSSLRRERNFGSRPVAAAGSRRGLCLRPGPSRPRRPERCPNGWYACPQTGQP